MSAIFSNRTNGQSNAISDWSDQPFEQYKAAVYQILKKHDRLKPDDVSVAIMFRGHLAAETPKALVSWMSTQDNPRLVIPEAYTQQRIRQLNYLARTAMGIASRVVMTQGIAALSEQDQSAIREKVELFNDFSKDNDPYREEDFGSFEYDGHTVMWKVDYFDKQLKYGSEYPANPYKTTRMLTIMLAHEY